MKEVIFNGLRRHGAAGETKRRWSWQLPPLHVPYKGVFPVVPTVFDGDGRLDLSTARSAPSTS